MESEKVNFHAGKYNALHMYNIHMQENEFKDIVRDSTLKLVGYNYQISNEPSYYSSNDSVEFENPVSLGVICIIRFQPMYLPDIHMFQVWLIRHRLEIHAEEDSPFKPLIIDLRNLMLGLYEIDIFPPKQYAWEFDDKEILLKQIEHAQQFILKYGIQWLEDPMSNIDWVRRRRSNPRSPS